MLDDTRLRIFLSAAETGNFTQTAKLLKITQPAVSQNISELEKSYGLRLFDRTRGALKLTPEGIVFKNYAESITNGYEELETVFKNFHELESTKEVRIATETSELPWVSAVLMPYIYKVCPHTRVSVSLADVEGDADLHINKERGIRTLSPSASFESSALYKLLISLK